MHTIKANRWYLTIAGDNFQSAGAKPTSIGTFIIDEDVVTGVNNVKAGRGNSDEIYNLSGVRVARASKPGVYVRNNKKIIM